MTSFDAFQHDGCDGFGSVGYDARNGGKKVLLYVCGESAGGESVWKLNALLEVLWTYDVGATCHYVDVHTDGSVYIAHDLNGSGHIVTKLDQNGVFVWGHAPTGAVTAAYFVAAAADGTSRFSSFLQVYGLDADGSELWSQSSLLSISQGQAVPIKTDADGNTLVGAFRLTVSLESNTQRLAKISPTGVHLGFGGDSGYQLSTGGTDLMVLYVCGESAGGESVWKLNALLEVLWTYDVG
ncbi:MAG: hypothetical protein AAF085_17555, partial [Planctomycetota bacterium]